MKVSVIIPVWNTGKSACALIEKLLPQLTDMEIIVIDDGSTDDSLAELKHLAKKDRRIKILSQKNSGVSSARNAGINISRGEYLCFLDSDDSVAKNYLETLLSAIEKSPSNILAVCGIRRKFLASNKTENLYLSPARPRHNREKSANYILSLMVKDGRLYSSNNKLFRGDLIREKHLRFDLRSNFAEDTAFVLDYLKACEKSKKYSSGDIIFINKPLYFYNYGTETSTIKTSALSWRNWQKSFRHLTSWTKSLGPRDLRTFFLLFLIYLRWHVSHFKSLLRSQKSQNPFNPNPKNPENPQNSKNLKTAPKTSTPQHAWRYIIVGIVVTLFDFLVCTLLTRVIFNTNDSQELSSLIATFLATFVAYFLHSKITWRDRNPGKTGIIKFFIWNLLAAFLIKPFSTWLFGLPVALYQWLTSLLSPFNLSYDTVEYLGVYALSTLVIMILNFFFYDRFVFGKSKIRQK